MAVNPANMPGNVVIGPGTPSAPTLNLNIQRVGGLHRLYLGGTKRVWVGAFNFEGGYPDTPFYLTTDGAGAGAQIMPWINSYGGIAATTVGLNTASGADWHFIQFRKTPPGAATDYQQSYYAIATNQVDSPFVLMDGAQVTSTASGVTLTGIYKVIYAPLQVAGSNTTTPLSTADNTSKLLVAARAICAYSGSIVYGGYRMTNAAGAMDNFDNYITFSDVGEPSKLAQTGGTISNIRIGDSDEEFITAVATNTVPTDIQGLKGQLVVFTSRKVVIFDGIPPSTNNPQGINFQSVVTSNVGTNAPRSVISTPEGLIFLGSDGYIYLIRGLNPPRRVSTHLWQIFRGLTPRQQKQCAAVWDPRYYYKLSYPEVGPDPDLPYNSTYINYYIGHLDISATQTPYRPENVIPDRQIWGDFRGINEEESDLGVKWFGPMTEMKYSCFAIALGQEDHQEILAGSAADGSVFQTGLESQVTDPQPTDVTTPWAGNSSSFNLGDIIKPTKPADWAAGAKTLGARVTPSAATNPTLQLWQVWECTTGGTGGTEPAWGNNPTIGNTVSETGGVIWTYRGPLMSERWALSQIGTTGSTEPVWPATNTPVAFQTTVADGTAQWTYVGTMAVRFIESLAITGLFDLGDAHVDKTINGYNFAVGTDRSTTIYSSVIVTPSDLGAPVLETDFTDVVAPAGDVLGNTFTAGTSQAIPGDQVITLPHRPGSRMRGKMFRFALHEAPGAGARMYYSDLQFRATISPRRK